MNGKWIIAACAALIVLTVIVGTRYIRTQRQRLDDSKGRLSELDKKQESLSREETTLLSKKVLATSFERAPYSDDILMNRALMRRYVSALLAKNGLDGTVVVRDKTRDKSFPPMVEVYCIPLQIGINEYALYGQVLALLEDLRKYPFVLEAACVGCTDIAVPGKVRFQGKYFVVPE